MKKMIINPITTTYTHYTISHTLNIINDLYKHGNNIFNFNYFMKIKIITNTHKTRYCKIMYTIEFHHPCE